MHRLTSGNTRLATQRPAPGAQSGAPALDFSLFSLFGPGVGEPNGSASGGGPGAPGVERTTRWSHHDPPPSTSRSCSRPAFPVDRSDRRGPDSGSNRSRCARLGVGYQAADSRPERLPHWCPGYCGDSSSAASNARTSGASAARSRPGSGHTGREHGAANSSAAPRRSAIAAARGFENRLGSTEERLAQRRVRGDQQQGLAMALHSHPHRPDDDPRDDLDLAGLGIVEVLDGRRGATYPDISWEPQAAFSAVAEFDSGLPAPQIGLPAQVATPRQDLVADPGVGQVDIRGGGEYVEVGGPPGANRRIGECDRLRAQNVQSPVSPGSGRSTTVSQPAAVRSKIQPPRQSPAAATVGATTAARFRIDRRPGPSAQRAAELVESAPKLPETANCPAISAIPFYRTTRSVARSRAQAETAGIPREIPFARRRGPAAVRGSAGGRIPRPSPGTARIRCDDPPPPDFPTPARPPTTPCTGLPFRAIEERLDHPAALLSHLLRSAARHDSNRVIACSWSDSAVPPENCPRPCAFPHTSSRNTGERAAQRTKGDRKCPEAIRGRPETGSPGNSGEPSPATARWYR